jgi:hypothetical protein
VLIIGTRDWLGRIHVPQRGSGRGAVGSIP